MKKVKVIGSYILVFLFVIIVFITSLGLTGLISKKSIKNNISSSAQFFEDNQLFPRLNYEYTFTEVDHYADCILFHIIYQVDTKHAIKSTLDASYYDVYYKQVNDAFLEAVNDDIPANVSYARYWHGSMVILRPLLFFFNIKEILIINGVVLGILFLIVCLLLYRKKQFATFFAIILSSIINNIWMVPFSIEYTTTFLVMLISAIVILKFNNKKAEFYCYFFFVVGMVTCFVDFLTTETITILVPLILLEISKYYDNRLESTKKEILFIVKSSLLWVVAYGFTWLSKWTIASVVLHRNVFNDSVNFAGVRMNQLVGESRAKQLAGAIINNLQCLFPMYFAKEYGQIICITLVCGLLLFSFFYLFRNVHRNKTVSLVLLLLAVVPYVRYLLVNNHSYMHYFFTYRAQFASLFAIYLLVFVGIDKKLFKHTFRIKAVKGK